MNIKSTLFGMLLTGVSVAFGFSASAEDEITFFKNEPNASVLSETGGFTWTDIDFNLRTIDEYMRPSRFETRQMMESNTYDTWLYSPQILVPAEGKLTISFKAGKSAGSEGTSLEVCYGEYPLPSSMIRYCEDATIDDAGFTRDGGSELITATAFSYTINVLPGKYYIGFHNNSVITKAPQKGCTYSINAITCTWKAAEGSGEDGENGTDSIGSIIAEGTTADVYGIDGSVVLRGADAVAIRSLSAGLYIINGQKYFIK